MTTPTPNEGRRQTRRAEDREFAEMYEKAKRDLARVTAERDAMRPFWTKHALGPLAKPSCLCCGKSDYDAVAVKHIELPQVVICDKCKASQARANAALEAYRRDERKVIAEVQGGHLAPRGTLNELIENAEHICRIYNATPPPKEARDE